MVVGGSYSGATAAPSMIVTVNRDGRLLDPTSTPPIGQDMPITITWALQEADAGTVWESCSIPFDAPIKVDEVTPSATFNGTSTYTFAPETRSVSIRFHGTALTSSGAEYQVMQCRAVLSDRTHVYKNVVFRIGQAPSIFMYLPQIER
jgi:hypothetical protein